MPCLWRRIPALPSFNKPFPTMVKFWQSRVILSAEIFKQVAPTPGLEILLITLYVSPAVFNTLQFITGVSARALLGKINTLTITILTTAGNNAELTPTLVIPFLVQDCTILKKLAIILPPLLDN